MEFKRHRELKRTKIEIIPMIDTIFFLLVFFMLSSLALVKLNGLPVNLPTAATAVRQQTKDLTITVDKAQRVYVNKKLVNIADLAQDLADEVGPGGDIADQSVVINADLSVPHGLVVHCMDAARQAGISHFAIATAAED
ncbi:MAG: biopolymer transporter ExbD [Capsulimonadaceae bacterium]|nr:biopolymer transporter ExbD [Capsulimonadaceae bacterium]